MSNTPAFPLNTPKWHESVSDAGFQDIDFTMGMTLRDYFAAKAMQALLRQYPDHLMNSPASEVASDAYSMADAMLAAREEE
jgi:hypothetical protein